MMRVAKIGGADSVPSGLASILREAWEASRESWRVVTAAMKCPQCASAGWEAVFVGGRRSRKRISSFFEWLSGVVSKRLVNIVTAGLRQWACQERIWV